MGARFRGGDVLNFRGDLVALCHHSDTHPIKGAAARFDWSFNAGLSRLWRGKPAIMDHGVLTLVPAHGKIPADAVVLVGLGPAETFSRDLRRDIYRRILKSALDMGARTVAAEGLAVKGKVDKKVIKDVEEAISSLDGADDLHVSIFLDERSVLEEARKAVGG
jgi:hypothetical protein